MSVGDRERAYLQRLGTYKTEAQARHLALPLSERLRRSWALYETHRRELPRDRHDDPTQFYDRARALGLYRP